MLILFKKNATKYQKDKVVNFLRKKAIKVKKIVFNGRYSFIIDSEVFLDKHLLESLPGVEQTIPMDKPFHFASKEKNLTRKVEVGNITLGAKNFCIIAGPCAVENRRSLFKISNALKQKVHFFRGGAFKPRTSPYSFQGLGVEGWKLLAELKEKTGMYVVSEVLTPDQLENAIRYIDVIQIGARNMFNYELLKEAGQISKPILLKRGIAATVEEFLMAAEYILSKGNNDVILCERGIRTFETTYRFTLDITSIPVIKQHTHLPIIVDPSHASGKREHVIPLSKAALAAGADGIMLEVHNNPRFALSDGQQSLFIHQFNSLYKSLCKMSKILDKKIV